MTRRIAVAMLMLGLAALPAVALGAAAPRPLLIDNLTGHALVRPAKFCPANHSCFTHARWARWGATASAVARGDTQYPGGRATRGTATVLLSRPRRVCGRLLYTRAQWRYRSGGPTTRSALVSLGRGHCAWSGA